MNGFEFMLVICILALAATTSMYYSIHYVFDLLDDAKEYQRIAK